MYHGDIPPEKEDLFRQQFKYYKSRKPMPSLKKVITISNENLVEGVTEAVLHSTEDPRATTLGLIELRRWQLYSFDKHPGLLYIRNPFTSLGQRYWIRKSIEEYSKKPSKTNIDAEQVLEDWWSSCFKDGLCNRQLQKKLRWCTLGYHHNWDTKIYSDDNWSPFPDDLAELCDVIANYLGYSCFKAEAAIVNYYHRDSTLSPHTDHSEVNLDAPLFSFSFGQPAIFLIGGREKTVAPSAIQLRSGDIVIMAKEARLCYHAVPKILEANETPFKDQLYPVQLSQNETKNVKFKYIQSSPNDIVSDAIRNINMEEWKRINNYIAESRINMNVRQVLYADQVNLKDVS